MDAIDTSTSQFTARNVDPEHTYTLYELESMPFEALEELYRAIPPDTFEFYEETLRDGLQKRFSDPYAGEAEQREIIEGCLDLYQDIHPRVPLDRYQDKIRWVAIPPRVLEAEAHKDSDLSDEQAKQETSKPEQASTRPYIMAGSLALAGICLIAAIMRSAFTPAGPTPEDLTATVAAATQFALTPPTPTSLALENIDRPIGAGQNLRDRYPVILEITRADGAPRVFAVQQKEVDIAQWDYVAETDVASSILGLVIRPVLGIPYSDENKTFLESLAAGDQITLRMSTNQTLHYSVSRVERVAPQSSNIFDQNTPGVVIAMLADPAPDRLVIYGSYLPTQETSSLSLSDNTQIVAANQPVKHGNSGATITAIQTTASDGPAGSPLPADWIYLLVDLRIATTQPLNSADIIFRLLDQTGTGYSPATLDPSITTYPPFHEVQLPAGEEIETTLGFLIPAGTRSARLTVQVGPGATAVTYNLELPDTNLSLTAHDLDVQILSIQTEGKKETGGQLVVKARLYNAYQTKIEFRSSDVYVVYSPSVLDKTFPVGPSTGSSPNKTLTLPLTIKPGDAYDAEFRFSWQGDVYVGIVLGGYQFVATLY